jgi:hypothetical protein
MPQEISVSYQAIKSKVYRLIDSLVVGEKNESEVQESIRRWWALIHPADRPIAQKYLLMVLGRSASALDCMGDAFLSVSTCEVARPHLADSPPQGKRIRLLERMVKESSVRTAV